MDVENEGWTIFPAPASFNVGSPKKFSDQRWVLNLSGSLVTEFWSEIDGANWHNKTFVLVPNWIEPLTWAMNYAGVPIPLGQLPYMKFDQSNAVITLNSIFDKDRSVNAGFSVEGWRIEGGAVPAPGPEIWGVFTGMEVDLAVRDRDACLRKIGFHITLVGTIVLALAS